MRKGKIAGRVLTIILSAAMVVTSIDGSCLMAIAKADTVSENQIDVTTDQGEDAAAEETDEAAPDEAQVGDDAPSEQTDETEENEDVSAQDEQDEDTSEADDAEWDDVETDDEEEIVPEKAVINENDPITATEIPNEELRKALVELYNKDHSSASITLSGFTYGHLKQLTEIDLTDSSLNGKITLSKITSVDGLGYASEATEINISNLTYLTVIGKEAFFPKAAVGEPTKLTTVVLPTTISEIQDSAFLSCTKLTSFYFGTKSAANENVLPATVKTIGNSAFASCSSLTKLDLQLPAGSSGYKASIFRGCSSLKSINIGKAMEIIPDSMFYSAGFDSANQAKDNKVTLTIESGSNLKKISASAFQMANIEEIDLSNCTKLAEIGDLAFMRNNGTGRNDNVASKYYVKKLILPTLSAGATMTLGAELFFNTPVECVGLEGTAVGDIVLPDYVTSLGQAAFAMKNMKSDADKKIKNITLSANMDKIGAFTFYNLEVNNVSFPAGMTNCKITEIGDYAFANTPYLTSGAFVGKMNKLVRIGEHDRTGDRAGTCTYDDYKAKNATYKMYGCNVFYKTGITDLELPASLRKIGDESFTQAGISETGEKPLKTVVWKSEASPSASQTYEIGELAFFDNQSLVSFIYPKTAESSVFKIGNSAFSSCKKLAAFKEDGSSENTLPKSLTEIENSAFYDCESLPSMRITDNYSGQAPAIGKDCFKGCKSMTTAELPAHLTVVPEGLFYDAPLTEFPYPAGAATSGITIINKGAFFGNGMATVDLSKMSGLSEIGNTAFGYVDFETSDGKVYIANNFAYAPTVKVILPAGLTSLKLGNFVFQGAQKLTTLSAAGVNKPGMVYIPAYISSSAGINLFAMTAVTQAGWEADEDGKPAAGRWISIPNGMFMSTDVTDISNVLPKYATTELKQIGAMAFFGCNGLETVDLTPYQALVLTGDGVFSNCMYLQTVKLPLNPGYTKISKNMFRVGEYSDVKYTSGGIRPQWQLKTIEIGENIEEIGDGAFGCFSDKDNKIVNHESVLAGMDFSKTGIKVKTIGKDAFRGHYQNFKTLNLDGVETVGESSFKGCEALTMNSNTPMANSVKTIGKNAFEDCKNLGQVKFGSGLQKIMDNAFLNCSQVDASKVMTKAKGLVGVDFSAATQLGEIGANAFKGTALTEFILVNSAVSKLPGGALSSCPYLNKVQLGESVKSVEANAINGCPALKMVKFSSTTTMVKDVFAAKGEYKNNEGTEEFTNPGEISFECNPVNLLIAKDRVTKFPYYVTEYNKNNPENRLGDMYIGLTEVPEADKNENYYNEDDAYTFLKVKACTSGYFIGDTLAASRIETKHPSDYRTYYEATNDVSDMIHKTENNKEVLTFDVIGLKETPADQKIPFTITGKMSFTYKNTTVSSNVIATFKLSVADVPYRAELYTDQTRTAVEAVNTDANGVSVLNKTVRAQKTNTTGAMTYFYDIVNVKDSVTRPDNCNLIIESSDPSIMQVGGDARAVAGKTDQWKIEAMPYSATISNAKAATNNKRLVLTPKKSGAVTITIYPEGSKNQKTTMNFKITADITGVRLALPNEARNGVTVGQTFNILDSIQMYLGQSVSKSKGDIADYKKYTDNVLTFTSDRPDLLSVDNDGNITVKSVNVEAQQVKITVKVTKPDGDTAIPPQDLGYDVKYPPLKTNESMTTTSGETVKVTTLPSKANPQGAVTYVKPAAGTKTVVIPSTMTVNGTTCKVTAVDKDAFKSNKKITSVTIKAGIKELPDEAFSGCKALTKVTLPNTLEKIGNKAFKGCAKLTKITIPKKVTWIGDSAFSGCSKLKTVTINAKGALTTIGKSAFSGCKVLKQIVIPAKVTTIGDKAFYKCAKLKKITVKTKVLQSVGNSALKGIYKKAVITVPKKKKADYVRLFAGKGQKNTVKIK